MLEKLAARKWLDSKPLEYFWLVTELAELFYNTVPLSRPLANFNN